MPKIAFIYPGYENLGIEYLSAALKKAGHSTHFILDPVLFADSGGINITGLAPYFSYSRKILKEISQLKPDLICFSCVSDNFSWAINIASQIKDSFSIPTVFGGIHPTSLPEAVIKHGCVDAVCVGEGDDAIVELASLLGNNTTDYSIKNLIFKNNGNIISNNVRPLIGDLDSLPFPDKGLYYERFGFMLKGYTIITSRGCPHACNYCANSFMKEIYKNKGSYLRRRSVENVIEELKIAKERYRPKFVHFCDEVFTYDEKWLEKFIYFYTEYISLPFICYVSPVFVNEKIVGLLKEGGCCKVQMGVQDIDEKKRKDLLNRHYSNALVAQAINIFKKKRIYITCDHIFGLPGQDEQELIKTAEFYSTNKPDNIEVFWLKYYPRTKISEIVKSKELANVDYDKFWNGHSNDRGIARGGDTYNPEFARFQLLLNLFHFIPSWLRSFLLKNRLYRFLPALNPIFITILFRLFNRAKFDLYVSTTFRRYVYFIAAKLSGAV